MTKATNLLRALTVVGAALAITTISLAACGRQVTGLGKSGGLVPSGETEIIFGTEAQINPQLFSYLIVLNTQGNQNEPYALGSNSNYTNWSYVIQVGGSNPGFTGGSAFVSSPLLYQFYTDPSVSVGYATRAVVYPTNSLVLRSLSGGLFQNGFAVEFNRCLLDLPNPTTSPQPSPNPASICPPFVFINQAWAINIFTVDNTGTVVDSLGNNGPSDTSVTFTINTGQLITSGSYQEKANITPVQQGAAGEIAGIQVYSTP
ncbi:MAG TPA: hypothetical protein VMD91_10060 [Candidatus Sulfotelmatobacter sp.]|nr:hypothetical protein [Candidatus Sulfotelmatobacter sp.]